MSEAKLLNMRLISTFFVLAFLLALFSHPVSAGDVGLIENSMWQFNLTAVRFSATAWGDVDNDGDLDLALTGCLAGAGGQDCDNGVISKIYTNNGTSLIENNTFSQNLTGIGHGSVAWGDVDNEGDLDLVITGCTSATSASGCIGNIVSYVYINNGTSLIENSTWSTNLTAIYYGNLALSDIDNDGRIDLSLLGSSSSGKISKVYINNGTSFVENSTWGINLTGLNWGALSFADINNDEYVDLAITGRDVSSAKTTKVYINNGTSFVENSTWEDDLIQCDESGLIFGDYDNDMDMDMVIMGCCDYLYTYKNNGSSFIESQKNVASGGDLGGGLFDGSIAFGDYDNDGDLDFVGIGREDGRNEVYNNNETTGYLFEKDLIAGNDLDNDDMHHGALAWGDVDNDNDLDLVTTGIKTGSGIMSKIYINNNSISNVYPSSPNSNMNSFFNFSTGKLTLSWGNGSDEETPTLGLYYNLRVGTCPGCHDVVSGVYGGSSGGEYRGGGPASGYFGNMMQRKSITLNRPDLENKTIYWAVQTIDTGLAKSTWSTEQVFQITQSCTENWSYGEWGSCVGGQQTRTATDLNDCGTFVNRSAITKSCTSDTSGPSGPSGPIITQPEGEKKKPENATEYFERILAGVDTGVSVDESGLAVHQVWVKVRNEVREVSVFIKKLESKPILVTEEPEEKVYQYLNITYTNLHGDEIETGKIYFKVEKEWIENSSINKSTVLLLRYRENEWQKLKTEIREEDSDYVNYQAETPGFSIFAIAGKALEEVGMVCVPMEKKCENEKLLECSIDGIAWMLKEVCEYGCEIDRCKELYEWPSSFVFIWLSIPLILIVIGFYFLIIRKAGV